MFGREKSCSSWYRVDRDNLDNENYVNGSRRFIDKGSNRDDVSWDGCIICAHTIYTALNQATSLHDIEMIQRSSYLSKIVLFLLISSENVEYNTPQVLQNNLQCDGHCRQAQLEALKHRQDEVCVRRHSELNRQNKRSLPAKLICRTSKKTKGTSCWVERVNKKNLSGAK